MMGLISVAAAGAAAIVYVGHNGSQDANWMAFCQGFTNFCQAASEAVVLSFVAAAFFLCLVPLSALALKSNWLGVSFPNHDGAYLGVNVIACLSTSVQLKWEIFMCKIYS